jgi:hypothetical protein
MLPHGHSMVGCDTSNSQQCIKHCISGLQLLCVCTVTVNCWLMLIVDCGIVTSGKQNTKPVMICVFKWFTQVAPCCADIGWTAVHLQADCWLMLTHTTAVSLPCKLQQICAGSGACAGITRMIEWLGWTEATVND